MISFLSKEIKRDNRGDERFTRDVGCFAYFLLVSLAPSCHFEVSFASASRSFPAFLFAAASALRAWPKAFLEFSPPPLFPAIIRRDSQWFVRKLCIVR